MKTFRQIQEGVYDPNIFKAIFLAGGPGSGKSYVVRRSTGGLGMKIVNSDDIYEKMLKDAGLETTPEDIYSDQGQDIRVKAKEVTARMQGNFLFETSSKTGRMCCKKYVDRLSVSFGTVPHPEPVVSRCSFSVVFC